MSSVDDSGARDFRGDVVGGGLHFLIFEQDGAPLATWVHFLVLHPSERERKREIVPDTSDRQQHFLSGLVALF